MGSGRNINFFHEKYPEWSYFGNDIASDIKEYIKLNYPEVINYSKIDSLDTLTYLKNNKKFDLLFTHGHLMHLPDEILAELSDLIAENTKKWVGQGVYFFAKDTKD